MRAMTNVVPLHAPRPGSGAAAIAGPPDVTDGVPEEFRRHLAEVIALVGRLIHCTDALGDDLAALDGLLGSSAARTRLASARATAWDRYLDLLDVAARVGVETFCAGDLVMLPAHEPKQEREPK
ncbi:hypothetical protein A33M_3658 [Rhodovulum sp. PH10]|nr:hypothetical protein A33M_3658 [Rhodovulum sp. PH10]